MQHFLIPAELRDDLLRYLMTRPCGEVMQGVLALQHLRPAEAPRPEASGAPEKPQAGEGTSGGTE